MRGGTWTRLLGRDRLVSSSSISRSQCASKMSSDDSDFYGITPISCPYSCSNESLIDPLGYEDEISELQARVDGFNVDKWWEEQKSVLNPLKLQAESSAIADRSHLHNPYAGVPYAWQLTETVDKFLNRLPPRSTEETPEGSWIYICNPYIPRVRKEDSANQKVRGCEDEAPEEEGAKLERFIEGGMDQYKNPGGHHERKQ